MTHHGSSHHATSGAGATLSAFFDSRTEALEAIERLRANGVPESSLRLTEGAEGGATGASENQGFFEAIGEFLFPSEDRQAYAEGLARGGYLVTVRDLSPDLQETAIDVLEDAGAVDIDAREEAWRAEGWTGGAAATGAVTGGATGFAEDRAAFAGGEAGLGAGRDRMDDETVQVVEEQLRVGKRDTSLGRVRVRSYVREEPVREEIDLTQERVEIERRPVDRALAPGEDAFRERSIEAEERVEEAVVSKEARVVEEIGLRRETRHETISDTVRRTEVEIEDERADLTRERDPDLDRR
jgi:stress response protein YsnF